MKLTIGMATYRDFDGVYFSLNALRLYHADVMPQVKLVVVDNDPEGPQAERLRGFLSQIAEGAGLPYPADRKPQRDFPQPFAVQYVPMPGNTGTSAPRDHIFKVATGDAVLVIDSPVLLWPGSVRRLIEFYDDHPDTRDLLSGPLVLDSLAGVHTHFADKWRDGMWGTWDTDSRGVRLDAEPFDIPAQGLGLFSCRRDAWLGFNPHFFESSAAKNGTSMKSTDRLEPSACACHSCDGSIALRIRQPDAPIAAAWKEKSGTTFSDIRNSGSRWTACVATTSRESTKIGSRQSIRTAV